MSRDLWLELYIEGFRFWTRIEDFAFYANNWIRYYLERNLITRNEDGTWSRIAEDDGT